MYRQSAAALAGKIDEGRFTRLCGRRLVTKIEPAGRRSLHRRTKAELDALPLQLAAACVGDAFEAIPPPLQV
jgi:hypothetical protein